MNDKIQHTAPLHLRSAVYESTAKELLRLHNRLKHLYRSVQSGADIAASQMELANIENEYHSVTVSKQVFLSDWYAHYKFFAQSQIDWMDEQLHFHWWKDMIPLSAKLTIILSVVGVGVWLSRGGLHSLVC